MLKEAATTDDEYQAEEHRKINIVLNRFEELKGKTVFPTMSRYMCNPCFRQRYRCCPKGNPYRKPFCQEDALYADDATTENFNIQ
jgi:hypothetical protein